MKYRGKVSISKEFLEQFLALPTGVTLHGVEHELSHECFHFYLASEKEVEQWTFPTNEEQAVQSIDMDAFEEAIEESTAERFSQLTRYHSNETFKKLLQKEDTRDA